MLFFILKLKIKKNLKNSLYLFLKEMVIKNYPK